MIPRVQATPARGPVPLQPALGIAGAALLPAAFLLMLRGVAPFATHPYEICWWSLIAALDGVVWWRTRRSPIAEAPLRFLLLCLWSVAFWFLFELLNLRLRNWHYIFVGAEAAGRWSGSFLSYATVLPGVLLFAEALAALGLARGGPPVRSSRRLPGWVPGACVIIGIAFLVLPLLWPRWFYPLVWGSFALVLDPLNRLRGGRSLLSEWERGSGRVFLLYLSAGALAGLAWELLNFWARVKWVYTVPFFEELKLFEMPLLGFLGFPPFALECWVAMESLRLAGALPAPGERVGPRRGAVLLALALGSGSLAAAAALPAMDRLTFASVYPRTADLAGLSEAERTLIRSLGAADCFQLREALRREGRGRSPLARKLDLVLFEGIGTEAAAALEGLGVRSVEDLAGSDPDDLHRRLAPLELRHHPTPAEVRLWVRRARVAAGR